MKQSVTFAAVCNLIIVLAIAGPSAQSKSASVLLPLSPAIYLPGERLTYNVSFSNFMSAAHVELQVGARGVFFGREGVQLRAHVETTGVVHAALFAINNDYITYVDPQTGYPFHAQQMVRDGMRTSNTAKAFNEPGTVRPSKMRNGEIPGMFDFLSAIYRLRSLPLAEGSTHYLSVKGDTEDYQAEVKVTGRQTIKTSVGSFITLVSQVRVANNSRANGYQIRIFFSDDERHIPVLITARLGAGELRAELAGSDVVKPSDPEATQPAIPPTTGPTPVPTPQPAVDSGDSNLELPFKVGEQLNYQIFLGDIQPPAGNATFQVRARARHFDRDAFLFSLRAQTTNAAQRIFFANDQITSYVDPKALLPFRSEMSLAEGSRRLDQILTINQDYGTATSDKGERIEIPIGTHDYVSFFYLARTFNITPPRRNAVSILVNNKPKTLFISSLKRETVQIGSQKIAAIQLSLTTDDPQPDKYLLRVWISDDKRRLPLRLTASTQAGQVRADLAIIPLTAQ